MNRPTIFLRDRATSLADAWGPLPVVRKASAAKHAKNLIVVCAASELHNVADVVHLANHDKKLRALLVRNDVEEGWMTTCFSEAGIRGLRNVLVHGAGSGTARRLLFAWRTGTPDRLIESVALRDGWFYVRDCTLEVLKFPISAVPELAAMAPEHRARFTVDACGSFVEWEHADLQLGLTQLRSLLDPAKREAGRAARRAWDANFGEAVATVRREDGLRQTDYPGLSDRQVRRIEGGAPPGVDALRALADAHGGDVNAYVRRLSEHIHRRLVPRP